MILAQVIKTLQLLLSMKFMLLPVISVFMGCAPTPEPIKRQMIGLIEKFDRWDYNGDGRLSETELKEAEKLSHFSGREIVEFYDTGADGTISLREAQEGLKRLPEAREIAAEKAP